ncbi:DUF4232 domain-containing protein [Streptomyces sp. NBC_01341]|uniref:DUF4232 domain-containing protein n=1 Tax=Streptomyces sp. NBC_01341 TaxID=2903831 RepID=UPI002E155983|nr:DUF4232 domain-containing protein [Streptomyces sp. NBC_01341]
MRLRKTISAVALAAAVAALSGCAGFLVPAGEGEPERTSTPTRTAHRAPSPGAGAVPDTPRPGTSQDGPSSDVPSQGVTEPGAPAAGCPASGAVVDMGPVETAMFHRAVVLTLTNCGDRPYRVHGYPSVRVLDGDGKRLPVPVNPGGSMFGNDEGPEEITLRPGGSVRSTLAWVSTEEGGDLIEADALELAAAPDAGARVHPLEGHDVRLMDELNTTAWRRGTAG